MKRRGQRYGVSGRSLRRWEVMTNWADDVIEEEAEEGDEFRSDGDVLGEVTGKARRRIPHEYEIPYEEQWETDLDAYQASKVSFFVLESFDAVIAALFNILNGVLLLSACHCQ